MDEELRQLREEEFDQEAEWEQLELPFEPSPGSTADLDYEMWQKYLKVCQGTNTHPSVSDYVVWLGEQE